MTPRIVSVGVSGTSAQIFVAGEDGSTRAIRVPARPFLLVNKPVTPGWTKLKGNGYYCFKKSFDSYLLFWSDYKKHKSQSPYAVFNQKDLVFMSQGVNCFEGLTPKDLGVASIDIETTTLKHTDDAKVILISVTVKKNGAIERKQFSCIDFADRRL